MFALQFSHFPSNQFISQNPESLRHVMIFGFALKCNLEGYYAYCSCSNRTSYSSEFLNFWSKTEVVNLDSIGVKYLNQKRVQRQLKVIELVKGFGLNILVIAKGRHRIQKTESKSSQREFYKIICREERDFW